MPPEIPDDAAGTDEQAFGPVDSVTSLRGGRPEPAFGLAETPIDTSLLNAELTHDRAGACVSFEGRVRDRNEGRPVVALEYEAYPRMAAKEGECILAEARKRFDVIDARCIHRLGRLAVGEVAVYVAVLSEHREEGFAACRYIIDEVKTRVPIWKKEYYGKGESSWIGESDSAREMGAKRLPDTH